MYETALQVLKKINDSGFNAYIVGGYPRDLSIGRESVDIDICTNAIPKELKAIFNNSTLSQAQYGSVTLKYNNIHFEITTFRKEIKYKDNRFPVKIKYIDDLKEDLKRRDFTINTLCIDSKGNFIDLLDAKNDLTNGVIKTVGNSDQKIKMDILRSLRAIRFATTLNFQLDEKLKKSIRKYGRLLKKLSYDRKKEELNKIFNNSNSSYGIKLLNELNLAKYLDLKGMNKIIPTTTSIGIWAQFNVGELYSFTKQEKNLIKNIKEALNVDILNCYNLYRYGLYISTIVGEIKGITRERIVRAYNDLTIKNISDIDIRVNEICQILNKKPGPFIKNLYEDLENKILNNILINNKEDIISYIQN